MTITYFYKNHIPQTSITASWLYQQTDYIAFLDERSQNRTAVQRQCSLYTETERTSWYEREHERAVQSKQQTVTDAQSWTVVNYAVKLLISW